MLGKKLITHQTGPEGKVVKRLYVEESSNIEKEFYLSCLVDRASSKIAFISSDQGGMDIEEVAKKNPEKIITTKVSISTGVDEDAIKNIIKPFKLSKELVPDASELIKKIYKILKEVKGDSGLVIFHPFRLNKKTDLWYYSPHFHIIGFGWIENTVEAYSKYGYIIKNLGKRKSLFEFTKLILASSKIELDCMTSSVDLPDPDSYSFVIPSFAISAALT